MNLETFKTDVVSLKDKFFLVARRMLENDIEAEDAVQETLIRLWNARATLASHPNVVAYAMQTLKNVCTDKIRARKYTIPIENVYDQSDNRTPLKATEESDNANLIMQIVKTLPPLQQQIILMRDVEEYEFGEIAEITGSNVDAVKVNLSRARKKVRDKYTSIHASRSKTIDHE